MLDNLLQLTALSTQKDGRLNEVTHLAHVCQLLNDLNISVLGHSSPVIDLFDTDL